MALFTLILTSLVCLSIGLTPIKTAKIEFDKYQGQWYQIADYPQFYEYFFCNECTRATYFIQGNDSLRVINQARGLNDCTIKGTAKILDPDDPGKLSITFDTLSKTDAQYWVYKIDEEQYQWSIVSNENKDSCYILYRKPIIEEKLYSELLDIVTDLGFDINRLKRTSCPQ